MTHCGIPQKGVNNFNNKDMDAGGAVEIEEFLLGCLRLRGNAKAMDPRV